MKQLQRKKLMKQLQRKKAEEEAAAKKKADEKKVTGVSLAKPAAVTTPTTKPTAITKPAAVTTTKPAAITTHATKPTPTPAKPEATTPRFGMPIIHKVQETGIVPRASSTHTLEQLQKAKQDAKAKFSNDLGVDGEHLESYLTDEEFQSVFSESRSQFYSHPKWQQTNKKKEKGLF